MSPRTLPVACLTLLLSVVAAPAQANLPRGDRVESDPAPSWGWEVLFQDGFDGAAGMPPESWHAMPGWNGAVQNGYGQLDVGALSQVRSTPGWLLPAGTTVRVTASLLMPDTGANYEPPAQSTYIGDASLPSGNTANGSYTIKDNATLLNGIAANDQLVIGTGPGTHGSFLQQDNSTVTSTGYVIVGRQGATASYTLTGGSLNAQGNNGLWIADGASADGKTVAPGTVATFTQSAGTITLTNRMQGSRVVGLDAVVRLPLSPSAGTAQSTP